jgi:hypothetical protein
MLNGLQYGGSGFFQYLKIQARLVTRQVKTVERTNKAQYGF